MNLTSQQSDLIAAVHSSNPRNILGVARAGTGKTTTCIQGAQGLAGEVFMGAFNKSAAQAIERKLAQLGMDAVTSSTFHAAGLGALQGILDSKIQVDSRKSWKIADIVLKDRIKPPYWQPIIHWVSLAKQSLIGPLAPDKSWIELADFYGLDIELTPRGMGEIPAGFIQAAKMVLAESQAQWKDSIDFDDMLYLPWALSQEIEIDTYDYVFIDEAQDTNAARLWLAGEMVSNKGKLIAIGDDKQAIYGFTGALAGALDQIRSQFQTIDKPLTVCFRCPRAVILEAQQWVPDIEPWEGAEQGQVSTLDNPKDLLARLRSSDTVLCRLNAPLVGLAFQLLREHRPVRIAGRDIGEGLRKLVSKLVSNDEAPLEALRNSLNDYERTETYALFKRDKPAQTQVLHDKCETIHALCSGLQAQGKGTVRDLVYLLGNLFSDEALSGSVLLSTIHKAKGLEWPRVYILQVPEPKWPMQPWQMEQKNNLKYVAITRAQKELIYVPIK